MTRRHWEREQEELATAVRLGLPELTRSREDRLAASERTRAINHPRRTIEQSRKLADAGWFPFPELSEEENDVIFQARLLGFAPCFAAYSDAQAQANRTLAAARKHLESLGNPALLGYMPAPLT